MPCLEKTPRPDVLATSLKHLIDEIILVFPEGSEGEDAEIQGRICLRLLEQARQDADHLLAAMVQMAPTAGLKDRRQVPMSPVAICQQ